MQEKKSPFGNFSDNLNYQMVKKGIKAADLAKLTALTPTAISRYKSGRIPKVEELYRICKVLGVSMEDLLIGESADKEIKVSDSVLKIQLENERQKFRAMKAGLEAVLKKFS